MATTTTATTTTTTTTATAQLKLQNPPPPTKPKRRKCRETTISATPSSSSSSSSAAAAAAAAADRPPKPGPPVVSSPRDDSWCCPASRTPPPQPQPQRPYPAHAALPHPGSPFRIRFSPGSLSPVMDFAAAPANGHPPGDDAFASGGFTKFNSVLTAGLLNPMSPPPPAAAAGAALPEKARSSPTLFEMMASEPDMIHPRTQMHVPVHASSVRPPLPILDRQALTLQRISEVLASRSPGSLFNDSASSDIKLTLSSKDGAISVSMNVHREILVAHSQFFAAKLSDQWMKQQQRTAAAPVVEIADCDDVEVYVETLRLMYCEDLRRRLMKEDVSRVLGILKVSAAIGFDAGVLSCLEYLEAAPWAEDEEEKVASLLSNLRFDGPATGEVLKRVSMEVSNGVVAGNDNEEVLLKLLHVVLEGKDEKAKRDMKGLVAKMLRENSSQSDIRKESLYTACDGCLQLLRKHFLLAAESELKDVAQIARQANNLHWLLDIFIDRQIAEDFLISWASQSDMSDAHPKVPVVHRFEVSRVTARLFVAIGKGQLLASKDARCMLLQTWLVPFYDDFGWMRRASKGLDRHLIEDGLSNTILTLPLAWQQEIMIAWFDRFLASGEDCPNIQRGFEVWWRRAFWRRNGDQQQPRLLQITAGTRY
ncbi:BTB/POZ domain-containing protein At1g63850-like isoform X2 [Syzygium oleosum]|uniref:BTB/POZ domain-containing protein At1g63850-like isoform X2 n=1 Tax=Syzygium oleosum TaxID=219896 RepID=UPI0024BB11F8|nr:BTB/POZ domain-containing protein At1g63850-like isoform X2 [Syzygium oleosum]